MGDETQPSKKRCAGRELSRDDPDFDDEEVEVQEEGTGTFKKASDEVLATRRIVKPRRHHTSTSVPSSNPFAGIRLVPPPPQTDEVKAQTDKVKAEVDTKDNANSECEVKTVKPDEKLNESTSEPNVNEEKDCPTEQVPAVTSDTTDKAAEPRPNEERETGSSSEKPSEVDPYGEIQINGDKKESKKSDASERSGAPLSSFQQLSNTQNAFTGLAGTGFSPSTFSFGSLQKDGSTPTFSFGASNNGSTPIFGSVKIGTSIGTKPEGPAFRSLQVTPTETGEENEETVFSSDSALFEFLDGGWKERGKGEVKVNVLKVKPKKARLVMRTKGNLRLVLNASLYSDMKLTKMDKKGVTFASVNIANDSKDGLSTFALKFKDISLVELFSSIVEAHKGKPANNAKTRENSPKGTE